MTRSVPAWKMTVAVSLVATLAGVSARAQETAAPLTGAAARELSASLVADAAPGYVPTDVRTFVRRAVVLGGFATRVDAANPRAWRVLAEAEATLGDYERAAAAQGEYLRLLGGRSHEAGVEWIRYSLAALGTAEKRIAMLQGVAADAKRPKALRAAALVNQAAIEEGRGRIDEAITLYREALKLEPTQARAVRSLSRLSEDVGSVAQTRRGLALLRGNPLAVNVAWELGQLCREEALYSEALALYEYAEAVSRATGQTPGAAFRRDLLDCLLDAGLGERAVKEFTGILPSGGADLQIAGLLVEAHRRLGRPEKAAELIALMNEAYAPREAVAKTKGMLAAEVAWFQWIYRRREMVAANWAAMAMQSTPEDPFTRRVWGITHLNTSDDAKALEVLEELAPVDAYAAAALIDDAFARGEKTRGEALLAGAAHFGRRGAGWRELKAVAARHGAKVPDLPETREAVGAAVKAFMESGIMEMGSEPQKFIAVSLSPVAAEVGPAEPLQVRATLTNIGSIPIPLGTWGVLTPELMVDVRMRVKREELDLTTRIPAAWDAPRFLEPGASLVKEISLDTGEVAKALQYRPLSDVEFIVTPTIDPLQRNGEYVGALVAVTAPEVRLRRKPLVDQPDSPEAYYQGLVTLVKDLQGADAVRAMRAAEVTVSLLALAEKAKVGETGPAGKMAGRLREPELLSILRYALQQAAPAVRARALGALRRMTPTKLMLQLTAPCVANVSPVVRARAIDVIGAGGGLRVARRVTEFGSRDADPLVREMAEVVAGAPQRP